MMQVNFGRLIKLAQIKRRLNIKKQKIKLKFVKKCEFEIDKKELTIIFLEF